MYHGLLLVGFVEVLGIHSLDISIREEVKSAIGSEDSLKFSGTNLPVHRVLNRSQLAPAHLHDEGPASQQFPQTDEGENGITHSSVILLFVCLVLNDASTLVGH